MPAAHPIPAVALDDRLGFVGTAGSGKTYNAGTGVERLLSSGGRVIIPDPLGVWWGLGLCADGLRPAPWREKGKLVIFGGDHGDLPLNEHAGALIGETIAGMAESAILDLSGFGTKAAEIRFMLAFLTALYRHASNEPVHLVFDEADMWAPQQEREKGEGPKLLGMMETIVRRGRVKGFIPWLISQRPAVLNKNVLSQVDGLVAFKLTSSQDRAALGAWIEGQADRAKGKEILGSLPTLPTGTGVVWLPNRDVLATVAFPPKETFDSSRTPKRGERVERKALKPLDLDKLKGKLASIEEEAKANDPRALKVEVQRLTRELAAAQKAGPVAAWPDQREEVRRLQEEVSDLRGYIGLADDKLAQIARLAKPDSDRCILTEKPTRTFRDGYLEDGETPAPPPQRRAAPAAPPAARQPQLPREPRQGDAEGITGPQQRILDALAWWKAFGIVEPKSEQVAFRAGYSASSSGYANLKGAMRTAGLIDYPTPGRLGLTDAGAVLAHEPNTPTTREAFHDAVRAKLEQPQLRLLNPLIDAYPDALSSDALADASGYSTLSSGYANLKGRMRTLGFLDYPSPGQIRAADWLFP